MAVVLGSLFLPLLSYCSSTVDVACPLCLVTRFTPGLQICSSSPPLPMSSPPPPPWGFSSSSSYSLKMADVIHRLADGEGRSGVALRPSLSGIFFDSVGFGPSRCKCQSPWRPTLWLQRDLFYSNLMVHLERISESTTGFLDEHQAETSCWSKWEACGFDGVIAVEMLMSRVISDRPDSDDIRTVSRRRWLISHLVMSHFLSTPRLIMPCLYTAVLFESFWVHSSKLELYKNLFFFKEI